MKPNMVCKTIKIKSLNYMLKYLQTANAAIHYIAKSDVEYSDYYISHISN